MTTWFTSDTHFSHGRILELSNRPFKTVVDMNEVMVANWNEVVAPDDIVFHLGDAVMGPFEESVKYLGRLNGNRFLIPGNHDRVSSLEKPARQEKFRPFYEDNGFTILSEQEEVEIGGESFILCHYPFVGDSHGSDRHSHLRPKQDGRRLLHGHVHEKWKFNHNMFNVGVDVNDFRPVSEDVVKAWKS